MKGPDPATRAAERRRRVRLLLTFAVVLIIVGGLGGGAYWAKAKDRKEHDAAAAKADRARIEQGPPWALPADPVRRAKELGLDVKLGEESTEKHIHAHLSLFVNGVQYRVPANLGIGAAGDIAELHTHDTRGVLHVESFTPGKVFTLQQVFDLWELPLSRTGIGRFETDAAHTLKFYVDGKEVQADPKDITLEAHREIGVVYGTAEDNAKVTVPGSFAFGEDE